MKPDRSSASKGLPAIPGKTGPGGRLKLPFFYGWVIVFISFWSSMLISGLSSYGFSLFIRALNEQLGWSRGAISGVSFFRTLIAMVMGPFIGRYADRLRGPQVLSSIGGFLAGGSLILLAFVQELWQFYLIFGILWGVAMITLGGQVVGPAVVSKWFDRKRGRALSIATMGISAGGVIVVPLAGFFIGLYGWRGAWAVFGVIMLLTVLPLGYFFMRRQPEDMGLLPDGDAAGGPAQQAVKKGRLLSVRGSYTRKQAVRTRAFWVFAAAQALTGLVFVSVLIHQVAYVQDKGFSLGEAAAVGALVATFAGISKIPVGFLADRFPARYLIAGSFLLSGSALWLLITATSASGPIIYVYSVLYGLGVGAGPVLNTTAWAGYFGRKNLGGILGISTPLTQWTGGIGPVFAGFMFDVFGSYDIAFITFSVAFFLGAVCMLFAGPIKEPDAQVTTAAPPLPATLPVP